jgi:CRISPR-associated protein Cmr2
VTVSHLLVVSVGPVQEFIAAARRTRDLWFGSHMLSEISRAVAVAVEKHGKLIFPESAAAPNVANIVLAELHNNTAPNVVAAEAKKAAQACWREFADPVRAEYASILLGDIWDGQVDDVVECYAAWAPTMGDYARDRARVMQLLAARKNCRDFLPADGRAGVPKSSLDGARESVLKEPSAWHRHDRRRLRVRTGEQLDVVGLVKRVAEGTQPYPSMARVAADPWLRGCRNQLGDLISACNGLNTPGEPEVIRRIDLDAHPHYADFPFEGTTVFRSRHHELREEAGLDPADFGSLNSALTALVRDAGEPNPYLAVLVADGDKMGETISQLNSADEHRNFSATLAAFAADAQRIVHEYRGVLVYAGGDDVFAFVPVDRCLGCARKLHDRFGGRLEAWGRRASTKITLSVGIAIGHFMEPLEDLRQYGLDAERHAKRPDRDGLAVHLHKRGGGPIQVRMKWQDAPQERLENYARLFQQRAIPSRLPYELRQMATVYERWQSATVADAVRRDVLRTISAKQGNTVHLAAVAEVVHTRVRDAGSLRDFAEELLLARQIATAFRQSGEETT